MEVESIKVERKNHTEYHVRVREWNENTKEWEVIWSAVRSQPFAVRVEGNSYKELT